VQLKELNSDTLELRGWITESAAEKVLKYALCDCHPAKLPQCKCDRSLSTLFEMANSRTFKPMVLNELRVKSIATFGMKNINGQNVVGILEGKSTVADSNSHIIVSTHHDHLGIGPAKNGDSIYNGAVDNASGNSKKFR
jgi:hypothetical protein